MTPPKATKLIVTAILVFGCSYIGTSFLWFPPTFGTIVDFARLALPPDLEHTSSEAAFPPGTRLDLSGLMDEIRSSRKGSSTRFVLTVFDTDCRFASASIPFWNRISEGLESDNVNHIFAACGSTAEDVDRFVGRSGWTARVSYAGRCEEVAKRLGMRLGIVQYVLDNDSTVVSAWAGKPIWRFAERDRIAQIRRTAIGN